MKNLLHTLHARRAELEALGRQYGIDNIRVFGSVLYGKETPDSDVDLLVTVQKGRDLYDFIGFKQDATELLDREVDVVPEEGLYHLLREPILKEARPL